MCVHQSVTEKKKRKEKGIKPRVAFDEDVCHETTDNIFLIVLGNIRH
jgi:hypothetical protein